jgi:hypothetical protein
VVRRTGSRSSPRSRTARCRRRSSTREVGDAGIRLSRIGSTARRGYPLNSCHLRERIALAIVPARGAMNDFASKPELILLPAVDVADGKAVRLTQGEAGTETNYGDPVDAALDWREQGASGSTSSTSTRRSGAAATRACSARSSARCAGAGRAVGRHPRRPHARAQPRERRLAPSTSHRRRSRTRVGPRRHRPLRRRRSRRLDVRGTTPRERGWTQEGGDLWTVLDRLEVAGCSRYVVDRLHEGRDPAADRTSISCARGHRANPESPSSRRAGSRASTTSPRCANSCRTASRARSWARPCTPAPSRCRGAGVAGH